MNWVTAQRKLEAILSWHITEEPVRISWNDER